MSPLAIRNRYLVALVLLGALAAGCEYVAVHTAPPKHAASTRTSAAVQADSLFWRAFHGGQYEAIPSVLEALTAAYLRTPNDAVTAAHVAWSHNWRIAESARLDSVPATITDNTIVARRYFQEAVALDPSDARTQGFLAGHMLIEGSINKDEKLTRQGYYRLLDAIEAWPEFNLFTAGYIMSRQPSNSPRFAEGLEWEWRNLDECIGERLDRANPSYARYMSLATTQGTKRVCWNSWIAPHNFEGFFLNMGDMLVKSGDWQTAQKIYANARLSPAYADWPYRDVLESRIAGARANVATFNAPQAAKDRTQGGIMISSPFACMGCHQEAP